jgi:hypothetical protein
MIKPKEKYVLETNQPLANYTASELVLPGFLKFDSHYKKGLPIMIMIPMAIRFS